MAALTPSSTYRESLGSLTLLIVNLTTGSSSDTYTIQGNSPVLDFWCQSNAGAAQYSPDVSFVSTTGVFTLSTAAQGACTLFILIRS